MNKKFIFRRAISAVLAVAMIAASLPFSSFAEDGSDSPTFSSDAANSLMKNTVPAGYDKTTNPYGYDVDHPFAMVEQNELFLFANHRIIGQRKNCRCGNGGKPAKLYIK